MGNYSRTIINNLVKYYPENEYHLFTPKIKQNFEINFANKNIFIHENQTLLPDSLWRSFYISRLINKLELDIFHGLSNELPLGINQRTKLVVSIHDLIFEKFPGLYKPWDTYMYKLKSRRACKIADNIIGISKSTVNDIIEHYGYANKIALLYQPCDEVFYNHQAIENNSEYYLYVGTINERKGLIKIIEAYNQLPPSLQIPFIIVGNGGEYKTKVINTIERYNLSNQITILNKVSNLELSDLYKGAKCLILPSQYEGFGLPVAEALLHGCPAIVSDVSSLPEVAGEGGIKINPNNIEDIKNAMIKINDPSIWSNLSQNGKTHAERIFNPKLLTDELIGIYKMLL